MTEQQGPGAWELARRRAVADEIYSWMGRRRVTQTTLAAAMKRSEMYLSRRLNGIIPFSIDDLFTIADLLDVPAGAFLQVRRDGDARQARPFGPAAMPGLPINGTRRARGRRKDETTRGLSRTLLAIRAAA